MKGRIASMVFVVALAATGQAVANQICERRSGVNQTDAGAPLRTSPAVAAMSGLALLVAGAVTRRSTIERA